MFYKEVKKIIDEWDPMRMWNCLCPPDEYNSEVIRICNAVNNDSSVEDITNVIFEIFDSYSDVRKFEMSEFEGVAKKIHAIENKQRMNVQCSLLKRDITDKYCTAINMLLFGGCSLQLDDEDNYLVDIMDDEFFTNEEIIDFENDEIKKWTEEDFLNIYDVCKDCKYLYWQKEDIKRMAGSALALEKIFEILENVKTIELKPIKCPKLNKEISREACYEIRKGISNKLSEIYIEFYEANDEANEICKLCEARKQKPY